MIMKLELNEYANYLRKSKDYILSLFDGLEFLEILKIGNDEERCWLQINCDYYVLDFSAEQTTLNGKMSNTERYSKILRILEPDITNLLSQLIEI